MRQIGDHNLELSYFQDDEPLASPFGMALRALMARFKMTAVNKV
jgi:hypothetical protein